MSEDSEELQPIGRVAETVGLSLRTIRYYEEIGLVTPSGRTAGGFRLYNSDDVDRLLLIKRMKPLGYPLEEMAHLLSLVDPSPDLSPERALAELRSYTEAVAERLADLRTKVAYAQEFHGRLLGEIERRARSLPERPGLPGEVVLPAGESLEPGAPGTAPG